MRQVIWLVASLTFARCMAGPLHTPAWLKPPSQSEDCCAGIESVQFGSVFQGPKRSLLQPSPPSPPTLLAQPLWWVRWHIVLDHQTEVTEPWSISSVILIQAYTLLPCLSSRSAAWQQPFSIDPTISSSMFPEDAISNTSTHRAQALCSGRTRRVIDLVCRLLAGCHWPPSSSAIIAPLPASPQATPHKNSPSPLSDTIRYMPLHFFFESFFHCCQNSQMKELQMSSVNYR